MKTCTPPNHLPTTAASACVVNCRIAAEARLNYGETKRLPHIGYDRHRPSINNGVDPLLQHHQRLQSGVRGF
jgi:hypothetical protein